MTAAFTLSTPRRPWRWLLFLPTVTGNTAGFPLWRAYGLAGMISFSRITTSNHFPADAFFGGAMGFAIARYALIRRAKFMEFGRAKQLHPRRSRSI
jgi:hypothetical protein